MLLVLRKILLDYSIRDSEWLILPTSFRLAFLKCLSLPSMEDVSLIRLTNFPFTSLLNNKCWTIKNSTVKSYRWSKDLFQMDSSEFDRRSISLESLSLQVCTIC